MKVLFCGNRNIDRGKGRFQKKEQRERERLKSFSEGLFVATPFPSADSSF